MANVSFGNAPSTFSMRQVYDQNFDTLEEILNSKVLFADPDSGANPAMKADIDMDGHDILNTGSIDVNGLTVNGLSVEDYILTEAGTTVDEVTALVTQAETARDAAQTSAATSATLRAESEVLRDESGANAADAQTSLDNFNFIWHGPQDTEPTKEEAGRGSIYYNTTDLTLYFCYAELYVLGELFSLEWRPVFVDEANLGDAAFLDATIRTYDPSAPRLLSQAIPTGSSNWGTSRMTPDGTKVWLTSGQPEATQHSLSTPFDMSTVSTEEASLSLPNSTQHILWNADGSKAYFISNAQAEVYEVALSTAYDLSTAGAVTTRSISFWSTTYNPVDWNTSYFGPTGDELFILTYNTNNGQSAFSSHALSTPYRVDTVGTGLESIVIDVDTNIRGFAAMSEDGEYVITFSTHTVVADRHLNSYVVYKLTTPYSLDSAVAVQRGKLDLPMTTALQFVSHVQLLDGGKKLVLNYKYSGDVVRNMIVLSLSSMAAE